MLSQLPVIGFTLDYETNGGYSKLPWYAIRENYLTAVVDSGAIPLPLPHALDFPEQYIHMIDGLVVTGGAFDVPPELYGDKTLHPATTLKQKRTAFESAVLRGMLALGKPVLGICGGMQLMNVILGGSLIQHIPDEVPNALAHEQPNPRSEAGHTVKVYRNTLLAQVTGGGEIPVNSAHHQAVKSVGSGVVISGVAPDGVIEAIEYAAHPFFLGVQWHPEYYVSEADKRIFAAFVEACKH